MGSNTPNSGNGPPAKPWERAGSSSGPAPFKPPSSGNTSDVVEASGTARPGEVVSTVNTTANTNALARPVPARPWQQNYGGGIGAGYGSSVASGIGTGMYSSYGGYGGGSYTGGMYGSSNNMYGGGGYGGGLYGGSGMYGGSMYNSGGYGMGMGSSMGMGMGMGSGMGMGMGMGGPYDNQDPNDPYGGPPSPPGFWVSFLRVMHGVVNFFGRISVLIDQNTHAFHMFMSALLQLFDRSGMLYGELARFVLRILGIRTKTNKQQQELGPGDLQHPNMQQQHQQQYIEGPKAPQPSNGAWDNVWGNDPTVGSS